MTEPFESHGDQERKRNSCKAIIIKENSILLTVNKDDTGYFYLLPGGGQRFGETLHEAVKREVLEETGWIVEPGELILSRDYIGANHEFAEWEANVHQTEMMFLAKSVRQVDVITEPDPWQTGIEWVSPEKLCEIRIYPSVLKEVIPQIMSGKYDGPAYLGDLN